MAHLLLLPLVFTADPEPSVRLQRGAPNAAFVVFVPLSPIECQAVGDAADVLDIRLTDAAPPVLGEYTLTADGVRFTPRFPFTPGQSFRAAFTPPLADSRRDVLTLTVPNAEPLPAATITHVHPRADRLPANLLRMYISFSRPMTRGEAAKHLRLLDADGQPVPAAFLQLEKELWSMDGTRFTLLFDPGRIKRGLVPHAELGPPLVTGRVYSLDIDAAWPDEHGQPLAVGTRKTFTAGPPDATPIDPDRWTLTPPAADTARPLVVNFHKPLDHAILARMLGVTDVAGNAVPGRVTVGDEDRVIAFAPAGPWAAGSYRLVVDSRLEDSCGNRVGRPFEVDTFPEVTERIVPAFVWREFVVR